MKTKLRGAVVCCLVALLLIFGPGLGYLLCYELYHLIHAEIIYTLYAVFKGMYVLLPMFDFYYPAVFGIAALCGCWAWWRAEQQLRKQNIHE